MIKHFRTILLIIIVSQTNCFSQENKILKPKGIYLFSIESCAGFQFNNDDSLTFINEIGCSPFELRLKWIDENTFIAIEKERTEDKFPPRVYVYRILISDGKKLVLKEFDTSWDSTAKDGKITVYKKLN
ncbi:MAG: hypothetical protein V4548_03575 [Bacteroidota bacterium]